MIWKKGHRAVICTLALGVILGQAGFWTHRSLMQAVSITQEQRVNAFAPVAVSTPAQLQQALDNAVQGTTIVLQRDMRLTEPLRLDKREMAIRMQAASGTVTLIATGSRHFSCAGSSIDLMLQGVVLDGGGTGGGILSTVQGLSLQGVTVQNCFSAASGGGIEVASGSLVIVEGTVVRNNRAAAYGGGVSTGQGAFLEIDGGEIHGNTAGAYGGGVFSGVGAGLHMDGGLVTSNQAVLGGGIYAGLANSIRLDGGEVSRNQAVGNSDGKGGGVYAVTCDITIDGARIQDNTANHGGGVYATGDGSDVVLLSGAISGNNASGVDAWGGGVYLDTAYSTPNTLTLQGGELSRNHGVRGGGVYAGGSVPSVGSSNPTARVSTRVTVNNAVVSHNTAGAGGGIYGAEGSALRLADCTLQENHAADGGAVYATPLNNLWAERATFIGNRADSGVVRPAEEDILLHQRQIVESTFTGSFSWGYNNHDIYYDAGEVVQQQHTVSFDSMGGAPHPDEQVVLHGQTLSTLPAPTRTGHTLEGWFTKPEGGEPVSAQTPIVQGMTLYARWRVNQYTITLDYTEGQAPSAEYLTLGVTWGERVGYLPIPTGPPDRAFSGWFDAQGVHYFPATVYGHEEDITLSAHWELLGTTQWQVVFEYGEADSSAEEKERLVGDGEAVGPLPQPGREGYLLQGWFDDEGHQWQEQNKVYEPLVLWANWELPDLLIRFDYMGADTLGMDETRSLRPGEPLGELPRPALPDLQFQGWYTADGQEVTALTKPEDDMTIYALFRGYVVFDYQGAPALEHHLQRKAVGWRQRIGTLPLPVRTGYLFTGWHGEPGGGGLYYGGGTSGKVFTHTGDLPLYADWHGNNYTLYLDYQGGAAGTVLSKHVTYGDNVGALPFPQKQDYRFGGWYTEPEGGGEHYFISTIYLQDEDTVLYAHWIPDRTMTADRTTSNPSGTRKPPEMEELPATQLPAEAEDNPDTGRR